MVKAIMHGCNGHMGQVITGLIKDDPEIEIVAGIDPVDCRDNGYPVFPNLHACTVDADVIIDLTTVWRRNFRLYSVLQAFLRSSWHR